MAHTNTTVFLRDLKARQRLANVECSRKRPFWDLPFSRFSEVPFFPLDTLVFSGVCCVVSDDSIIWYGGPGGIINPRVGHTSAKVLVVINHPEKTKTREGQDESEVGEARREATQRLHKGRKI